MKPDLRDYAIRELGCIVALHLGLGYVGCEKHHLTGGGKHGQKRRGEAFTVGLNPWSHRGVPINGMSAGQCRDMLGPSYAREPRAFRELYPDEWLLTRQNELLAEWQARTIGATQ